MYLFFVAVPQIQLVFVIDEVFELRMLIPE